MTRKWNPDNRKKHWSEGQRTACGMKMIDVPLACIVYRPSKITCLHCKVVLSRRRKQSS